MEKKLSDLQPAGVFRFFEELCAIPHGSGNTKMISDYLVDFARSRDIRYIQDDLNNVIMFAPGTCGLEEREPVIIQGHMDMVCEKDDDCSIDMDTQGLNVDHDSQFVFAHGTTLGGDDGIAVAYALAILDDPTIPHPPLEVVVTVDEETGMFGAAGIDLSMLRGRKLLNIDSEDEGVFTVSCAGGARGTITLNAAKKPVYGPVIRLCVDGLQGGHSGVEIHKNRANANKVMGTLLQRINGLMPLCITGISGGAKDNAIPRSCKATLVAMGTDLERLNGIIADLQQEIRTQYDEPEAVITGDMVDAFGGNALSCEDTKKVIDLLCRVPNGVIAWSKDIEGLVQTSLNLGVMSLKESFSMTFAVRSSVNQEKRDLLDELKSIAEEFDADYSEVGDYPAWEYRKDSPLRDAIIRVYRNMYGKDAEVVAIHAGLECGLLSEKIADLDCVSLGPQMHDIHTSREKLDIASTGRVWELLLNLLKTL